MLYLIDQHIWLLLVVFAFAAMGGWAWSALMARPREQALQSERERLMKEVLNSSIESGAMPGNGVSAELDREMDTLRRRANLDAARIAEMERALEAARSRASEASSRAAEAERALEAANLNGEELARLREQAAALAEQEQRTVDVEPAAMSADEERAAQAWRLRYFEQRVRYLESQRQPVAAPALAPPPAAAATDAEQERLRLDWRARYAEARARHFEQALREVSGRAIAPAPEAEAAPDELAGWRMSYLEKRLAHLQDTAPAPPAAAADDGEAERLKWRNRYLESRTRRLESLVAKQGAVIETPQPAPQPHPEALEAVAAPIEAPAPVEEVEPEPVPLVPAGAEQRPASLPAARGGAPDDFTLIDGVSPMLQSTLNSLGVYHFEQIANWSPANVAWVDQYLRLRGRIVEEEWVEQAGDLAREGPAAARRMFEDEYA
ncbi:MAG TPA: hypothetical protein VG841_03980 [Caulobacterales bacterium]|nr:hypothetical protein [Caulobacterales bacterium]